MALVSTEQSGFLRDTSNMALISNNKKTYDLYKKQKQITVFPFLTGSLFLKYSLF